MGRSRRGLSRASRSFSERLRPSAPGFASGPSLATGTWAAMEHACGFDRSDLYSEGGPPIGAVAAEPWAEGFLSAGEAAALELGAAF